jgi:GH18 family chitinase
MLAEINVTVGSHIRTDAAYYDNEGHATNGYRDYGTIAAGPLTEMDAYFRVSGYYLLWNGWEQEYYPRYITIENNRHLSMFVTPIDTLPKHVF